MLNLLSEEDVRFVLELLHDEMSRREGKSFGYAADVQIARLQAAFSVWLEVKQKAVRTPLVGPR